jgi:hypothetical protein
LLDADQVHPLPAYSIPEVVAAAKQFILSRKNLLLSTLRLR